MSNSKELANKSIAAALSAIEIYNKPDFRYREETFSILMVNAWELLFKARHIQQNNDNPSAIHVYGQGKLKTNRSGNPMTHSLTYLVEKLMQDRANKLTNDCKSNILLLIEARDNSVHFINRDTRFSRRMQEIGTATLINYMILAKEWFKIEFSHYNFYLMPLAFYHEFESVQAVSTSSHDDQMQRFLEYVKSLEQAASPAESAVHSVTLPIETKIVRSRDKSALPFRWTNDPNAPKVQLSEEDFRASYPYDYRSLTQKLRERYTDFIENAHYHNIRKQLKGDRKYYYERYLDPESPRGGSKGWFSSAVLAVFDEHYTRKRAH